MEADSSSAASEGLSGEADKSMNRGWKRQNVGDFFFFLNYREHALAA